ncbi:MAG: PAS domain S-box protein [Candidatus Helarchaeota archaeon]|nr:PAS domain S-box protein [Candidatus Helarchaeota archaeon]
MGKLEFQQNEAKYNKIFQYLNEAIFIHDLEGHILDVNDTACESLGYSKEELLQMTRNDIDTPEYAVKVPERIKELQKKGRFILETAHVTKDGRVIPIELSSSIIEFEDKPAVLSIARDLSERKRMQEDLQESNNKLETLFGTIEDFLFILDSKGLILQVNAIVEKRLGYSIEELYEQHVTKVHPPNRHEDVKKIISQLIAGEISVCPIPLIAKDGSVIPVETKVTQAKWGDKDILIGVSRDITDHLQAERELKESEEKFSNLFHHSNDAIFLHDLEANIIDINQKALDQFGYSRNELLSLKISDLHPTEDLDKSKWAFETIIRDGFVNFEINFHKKNGDIFPADVSSSLFEIGGKEVIQGVVRDITERKVAEKKLRESEENYRLISENANDLITIFNSRLEYEYINEEPHFKILGYSKDELIGKFIAEFLYPDDLKHPFTSYEYDFENIGRDLRYKRKNNTYIWLEVRGRTFISKDREIKAILIWRDITERKEAGELVKESEEQFRTITEQSLMGICIVQNNLIKYANETMSEIVEYSISEMMEWKPNDLFRLVVQENLSHTKKEAKIVQDRERDDITYDQYRIVTKSGKLKWVDTYSKTIKYQGKNAALVTLVDATKRIEAEQKLRESEEKYKETLDLLPDIVFETNTNLDLNYANQVAYEKFGYTREEFENGLNFSQIISPIDLEETVNQVKKIFNGESLGPADFLLRKKDNSEFWGRIHSSPIYKDGEIIGMRGVISDITNRKKAEEKLLESEARFRAIFDRTIYAVFIHDFKGNFLDANDTALKMLGYEREDITSLNFASFLDKDQLSKAFEKLEEIKLYGFQQKTSEYKLRTKNGDFIWIETEASLIYRQGKPYAILGIANDITERKKAEHNLMQSKVITDNINEALMLFDTDGTVSFINPAYEKLTGYKSSELIGINGVESAKKTVVKDELEKIIELFGNALKGEKLPPILTYLKHKDDREIPIEFKTYFVRDETGKIVQIAAVITDITERNKAEQQLKESEQKYRIITENANDMISVLNIRFKFDYINSQVHKRVLGYEKDELIGKDAINLIHTDDQGRILEVLKKGRETGEGIGEFRYRHKNGNYLWLETKGKIFVDIDGNEIALMVSREINERKKAEQQLKESEEKYRLITENANDLITVHKGNFNYLFCNEATLNTLGYSRDELLGRNGKKPMNGLDLIHPDDLDRLGTIFYENFGLDVSPSVQFRIRKKDGNYIWLETRGKRFTDETGKNRLLFISRDITERKIADRQLKESEEKFRNITEQSLVGICIIQNNSLIYANDAMAKINDISIQELNTWSLRDLMGRVHPEHTSKASKRLKSFKTKEKTKTFDIYRMITKSGKEKWVEIFSKTFNYKGTSAILTKVIDITERKKAEKKLIESEEKYRLITENVNVLLVILSSKFRIEYVNEEAHQRILGYTKADLIGKDILQLCHPDDIIKNLEEGLNSWKKREAILETRIRQKNGNYIWVEIKGKRFFDGKGKEKLLFVGRDINERKKAEQELKDSEEKYRLITENANDLVSVVNNRGRYEYINAPAFSNMLGYSIEDLIGKRITDFLHPDEIDIIIKNMAKGLENSEGSIESRFRHKDGHFIWLETKGKTLKDDKEKIKAIFVSRDITEKKESEQKLKESEEKFRTISEQSLVGIAIIQDNSLKYVNKRAADMFGYTIEEIINWKPGEFLKVIHPDYRNFIAEQALKKQSGLKTDLFQYVVQAIKKTGEPIWFENFSNTITYEGRLADLAVMIDITDKIKSEQNLKESEEKFRTITDQSFMGITIFQDGQFIYANEALSKIFEYSVQEIIDFSQEKISDITHPDERHIALERLLSIQYGKTYINPYFSFRITTKSGKKKWLETFDTIISYGGKSAILSSLLDITETKEAEKKLKESEEKYRLITENANDLVAVINDEFKQEYLNFNVHRKMLGYTKDEILNLSNKIVHPEDLQNLLDNFKKILETGEAAYEIRVKHKNGHYIYLEVNGRAFKDSNGKIKMLTISRDVTEKKVSEQKLKESEEKFRTISEQSLMGIAIIQDGVFKYVNEAASRINGYTTQEMLQWSPEEFTKAIHPEDLSFALEQARKKQAGDKDVVDHYSLRLITKSGKIKWVDQYSKSITYRGAFADLVTLTDITEKKEAEMELMEYRHHLEKMIEERTSELVLSNKQLQMEINERKKIENELKRSEEKFKSIADLSQDFILRATIDGKITFANPTAAEFLQKPAEQLIGVHFTEYTYPEDIEKTANALREIIKAGSPRIGFEIRLIVPKGIRIVKFSGTVIRDNTSKIVGVQATGRDVTELQEELIEKDKLAAVGQLAAGVAHELNTPLANITLKADYISAIVSNEKTPLNVDILHKEISAIKDQVKFCAQIVKDLLQFSRKMDLNIKRFELYPLLTELKEIPAISSKIQEKDIEIIIDKEKDVFLDADKVLLFQVFQNLITNSMDALEYVKYKPMIKITFSKVNSNIEIKVIDNGIGIKESDLPRVFEPFFSTKQIGKGTGLGLSICRGIIEKHGGKININSTFGKRTEVIVTLPIRRST